MIIVKNIQGWPYQVEVPDESNTEEAINHEVDEILSLLDTNPWDASEDQED